MKRIILFSIILFITISSCTVYKEYAIDPLEVNLMNEILTQQEIKENLKSWMNAWREVVGG